ncbi:MAG: ImmA/IrrE family metallo-endopeptidase [Chloroflexi bacterium]|nr:ImmA/IrrE family metallo-endopeptidase [Chloroflexota bacterium]
MMDAARVRFARTLAKKTLREFGATAPPVPVEAVLRFYGLTLTREAHEGAWSGSLRGDRVVVNATHPQMRQRFTAAHELGHVRLGHLVMEGGCLALEPTAEPPKQITPAQAAEALFEDRMRVQEIEANEFAAELLAPRTWVKTLYRDLRDPDRMADVFQLSRQAVWIACLRAGCIKYRTRFRI